MSNTSKGLGRGLNALFNTPLPEDNGQEVPAMSTPFMQIKIDDIIAAPNQPRQNFNEEKLGDLASSIRIQGILQPILVRPAEEEGKWIIIAGERRWRAAKLAGLEEIPVIVRDFTPTDAIIATMMENLHREDLNPLELAQGLSAIMEMLSINQTQLAAALGAQRGTISNILRMLKLSPQAQEDLLNDRISMGHARCLVTLPAEESEILRQRIIDMGMSVRSCEMAISFWNQTKKFPWTKGEKIHPAVFIDPDMKRLARQLTQTLNMPAKIKGSSERGKIDLSYESPEQFYEILEKLGLSQEDFKNPTD